MFSFSFFNNSNVVERMFLFAPLKIFFFLRFIFIIRQYGGWQCLMIWLELLYVWCSTLTELKSRGLSGLKLSSSTLSCVGCGYFELKTFLIWAHLCIFFLKRIWGNIFVIHEETKQCSDVESIWSDLCTSWIHNGEKWDEDEKEVKSFFPIHFDMI